MKRSQNQTESSPKCECQNGGEIISKIVQANVLRNYKNRDFAFDRSRFIDNYSDVFVLIFFKSYNAKQKKKRNKFELSLFFS